MTDNVVPPPVESVSAPLPPPRKEWIPPAPNDEEAQPPEFSDEALALQFTARYKDQLRFVAALGRWLIWDGSVWRFDDTRRAFDLARTVARAAAAECGTGRIATAVASGKTVAAIERLAKADRSHAATIEQWDALPWMLNTPGGTVDLRDGKMHRHRLDDYSTKVTAVAPGGDCPLWRRFLAHITGGDLELQAFLQRIAGYALTGSTSEHALFFGYGTGANGKGTFLNTLTGAMGNYAAIAAMETFNATQTDRHPTDVAMLRGARLVTAQETDEGRRFAEARIKALTGGDKITARFMRQDNFTYTPQFKLFIAGNHKPGLRNVDEAIRRRFHLIPFDVRIPPEERDKDLADKLRGEWSGILQWAINGCLEWQRIGLVPPEAVRKATDDYLEAEDAISLWLADCCEQHVQHWDACANLYASWQVWAERSGEFVIPQKRLSQMLEARGFIRKKGGSEGARGFMGLKLKAIPWADPPHDPRPGDE